MTILLIVIIIAALIFDYINGFHDAANSIATIVSTKVLTPLQAVIWAAFFNFVAFFIFSDHGVADTIAKTVKSDVISKNDMLVVIISGLVAAIIWNLFTWWRGIPSSSSHTLIGGFAGAAVAHAGIHSINPEPIIKTVMFIFLAPLIGMLIAYIISLWFINSFRKGIIPKIISTIVICGVALTLWIVIVTQTTRLIGIKTEPASTQGVTVSDVFNKSPAQKMGLQKGDIILQVNQTPIIDAKQLDVVLRKFIPREKISIKYLRKDETLDIATVYQPKYDSKFWNVVLYGENFKWLLMALILISISIFTMFLNTMNVARSQKWFKRMQLVSSAAFSIGHGGNDAQKVMGIITAALIAGGQITRFNQMPDWVPLACYTAISLGTLSGGWKIIKTMGTRITKVTPFEGVAAETAGALTLFVTENLKIPVSTTHTITGAIIGVGATKRLSAVRWGVTINLMWAWIITIPISALLATLVYFIVHAFI